MNLPENQVQAQSEDYEVSSQSIAGICKKTFEECEPDYSLIDKDELDRLVKIYDPDILVNAFMVSLWQGKVSRAAFLAENGCNPFMIDSKNQTVFHSLTGERSSSVSPRKISLVINMLNTGFLDKWRDEWRSAMVKTYSDNMYYISSSVAPYTEILKLLFDPVDIDLLSAATEKYMKKTSNDHYLINTPEWSNYILTRTAELTNSQQLEKSPTNKPNRII